VNKLVGAAIGAVVVGGVVVAVLAATTGDAPRRKKKAAAAATAVEAAPLALPAVTGPACECKHLKAMQAELRNAQKLQQAFRGQINALRAEGGERINTPTSNSMLGAFATGKARDGLEDVPGYAGPKEVDFQAWGAKEVSAWDGKTDEKLCSPTESTVKVLQHAMTTAACAGIAAAIHAHEKVHHDFCLRAGFRPYVAMHGSDRAQEEVEAYGAQIAVLQAEIAKVAKKCGYKASGQNGSVVYSGTICSLERPFDVTGTHPLYVLPFKFTPTSINGGTARYQASGSGVTSAGGGPYTIEGIDTPTPRIVWQTQSTASIAVATDSGGGTATINLTPLDDATCGGQ